MSPNPSKNLTYTTPLPPFLQRLHALNTAADGRHDRALARPKRARNAEEEEEDAPMYVDERGVEMGEEEVRGMMGEKQGEEKGEKGTAEGAGKGEEGEREEGRQEKGATIGAARRRKVGRVVGAADGGEEGAEAVAEAAGKSAAPKTKKKAKKVKLSFGDDE